MSGATSLANLKRARRRRKGAKPGDTSEEAEGLRPLEEGEEPHGDEEVLWELGEASDDEDGAEEPDAFPSPRRDSPGASLPNGEGERARMIEEPADDDEHRESVSSDATLAHPAGEAVPYIDDDFGDWGEGEGKPHQE